MDTASDPANRKTKTVTANLARLIEFRSNVLRLFSEQLDQNEKQTELRALIEFFDRLIETHNSEGGTSTQLTLVDLGSGIELMSVTELTQ